jgi:hypothetical protein
MATSPEGSLRFVPSRVEGLPDVTEVAVHPDRLELFSAAHRVVIRLWDIAEWPRPPWLWRLLARLGWWPRWLPVGERDWFHAPPQRFIRFFTKPPVVVYMPNEVGVTYLNTVFRRAQDIMRQGGFATWDLG